MAPSLRSRARRARARARLPAGGRARSRASAPRAGLQEQGDRRPLPSGTSLRAVEPLLVKACRREPVEHTPVWFMRQAGRSLPEYRALRERHGLFDIVGEPELCAEVTLQPVRRHDVDAAVMFADIMLPVLGMGVDVELVENVGPVVREPVTSAAAVARLAVAAPPEPILEAVCIVRRELRDDQAVV